MTALLGIVGSLIGGGISAAGSIAAAKMQADAAKAAIKSQEKMFAEVRGDLRPYMDAGEDSLNLLMKKLPGLQRPFDPTIEELEATPGYQFMLDQSLKAGQSSFASRGLASSGAAIKGAQDRAFGLASTTYQQMHDNYLAQQMQRYNMLMGPAQLGQAAAAGSAGVGAQFGAQIAQGHQNVGTAWGAGIAGAGNALGAGIQNALGWGMMGQMMGGGTL